jgi:hypothetical protein
MGFNANELPGSAATARGMQIRDYSIASLGC